jgi:putative oxidoreductase
MAGSASLNRSGGGLGVRAAAYDDLLLLVGRIAIVLLFVLSGGWKLMNLTGTAGYIASKGLPMSGVLAPVVGVFEIAAGLAIVAGFQTRIAAMLLAGFTVLASVIFHNFWTMEGTARQINALSFYKNVAMIGGLLLLVVTGPGRYSVDRR